MGELVLIYGKSGTGKSASMRNFGEEELTLIQVLRKRLPFKKTFKYTKQADHFMVIYNALKEMPTKSAVIDDAGYIMTNAFMYGHSKPRKGSNSFDLYNDIADSFFNLIMGIQMLPEDKIVYLIMHEDTNDYGDTRLRTIGKLLNEKVCIEGMASVALRCIVNDKEHLFVTQNTGNDISKSPEGMFDELMIPNDLKAVDERIRDFWNL